MQAYAEGFEVLNASEFELDLEEIAGIWRYGSVVRSWLLELLHDALRPARQRPRGHRRLRRRLRRGPLDDLRGDQRGRAGAGDLAPRSTPASPRARTSRSRRRSTPRSASSSAATPSSRRHDQMQTSPSARHGDTSSRSCPTATGRLRRGTRAAGRLLPTRPCAWHSDMAAMTETQVQRIRCWRGSGLGGRLSRACSSSSAPPAT